MTHGLSLNRSQARALAQTPKHEQTDGPDARAQGEVSRDRGRNFERVGRREHIVDRMAMTARALKDEPLGGQPVERDAFAELSLELTARLFEMRRRVSSISGLTGVQDVGGVNGFGTSCQQNRAERARAGSNSRRA